MYNEENIHEKYRLDLHNYRQNFVENNAEFKKGDFIYNVTGIIKVENFGYTMIGQTPSVIYYGLRYKKVKGLLSRTKDTKISRLHNHNLKKIYNPKLI